MLQHIVCRLQSTRSWAALPNSCVHCLTLAKLIILLRADISSILVHESVMYWMTYLSQQMPGHNRGLSHVLWWGMLQDGILFWTWCCGFSLACTGDTAGWQMWPINLILYKKLWSSEEAVVLPCECIKHRPGWGREGGKDRAIGFIPGGSVCLPLQEGRKKGWLFSSGQCKLLPFGSQCQVFLLHY